GCPQPVPPVGYRPLPEPGAACPRPRRVRLQLDRPLRGRHRRRRDRLAVRQRLRDRRRRRTAPARGGGRRCLAAVGGRRIGIGVPLLPKRVLVGRPLRSDRLDETLLPKRLALPVFCSDPLSSVAYATEQIVLVLGLGGVALLHLTPWVGLAVIALLVIVVASYRQTCAAYPNGGGAYTVSRDNLGEQPAL